jgi:putative endonuclease
MAYHNEIGVCGEAIAENWCMRNGLRILNRNYRKKYGEIDIVARETTDVVHFIEVKTVSYETKADLEYAVSHGTWRPEENVHSQKLKKLCNTAMAWLDEHHFMGSWQIDVYAVRVVPRENYATLKRIENIIVE